MEKYLKRNRMICFNCDNCIIEAGKKCKLCGAKARISPQTNSAKKVERQKVKNDHDKLLSKYNYAINELPEL